MPAGRASCCPIVTREQLVTTVLILTCAETLLLSGEKIRGHFGKGQNSIAHLRRSGAPELVDCFVGQQILRGFENSFANRPSSVALLKVSSFHMESHRDLPVQAGPPTH
jgi:hypothetical protein